MELRFEPKQWHSCTETDWQTCQEGVNCYAYALNQPEYHWAFPGLGFVKAEAQKYFDSCNAHFKDVSLAEYRTSLIRGAIEDGLIKVEEPLDREGYYVAALFFHDTDQDFHWYRKDDNGHWSHKDGWGPASDRDNNGNLIEDPRVAPSPAYTVLGSFFLVPKTGITLTKEFPLLK